MPYSSEDEIMRFLYTGTVEPLLKLPMKENLDLSVDLSSAVMSLASQAGKSNLPLQLCLVSSREAGLVNKQALLLVLCQCLKIEVVASKTAVYSALPDLVQSAEDLFDFLYYHRKVFKKRPRGMGAGMRRFISKWYLSKDPYDLALEVSRIGGRHGWEHRDLVQLAKVRSKDSAVAAVLTCVVRGLKEAQDTWGGKPEAQPILEYLACVQQVKNCTGDPGRAERLMEKHSFDIDSLPTELLSQSSIWENGLPRLPVRRVLSHLKSLARKGFLSGEAHPVLRQVLQCIKDPLALAASGLQPAEIVSVMAQAGSNWAPPPAAKTKTSRREEQKIPAPHSSLMRGLEMMLVASFNNVPKMNNTRLLVCVDTRLGLAQHGCWGMWSLSCVKAAAVTILSLKAGKADVTLTTMSDTKQVTPIPLVEGDTLDTLVTKLSSPPCSPGYVDPGSLITWARSSTRYSAVLVITDSHTNLMFKEKLWEEVGCVAGKFIYLVLASKEVIVANPENPSMLDICGWEPQLVRVVQAIAKDDF